MNPHRLAGAVAVCLLLAAYGSFPVPARASVDDVTTGGRSEATLFRVFLKDGTTLVSYGEIARLDNHIVFSMPTAPSVENPELHLVDIPSERVDWERTMNYAESARAARYIRTRAETDYAMLTTDIAQALNDVGTTADPVRRLRIVERARKALADWPPAHYNYKREEVQQMLGMLDEAIADLRAATGADRFDLSLVAAVAPPKPMEPLLPPPDAQEAIEQTLVASKITDSPVERTSLLTVALSTIERHAADLPADWVETTTASASAALANELAIDRAYQTLSTQTLQLATTRARAADVRGVQRVLSQAREQDASLGALRPDAMNAVLAVVEEQLDAARRLQLARDRWAIRQPELRKYRSVMRGPLQQLVDLGPALEDIKALAGSTADALGTILRNASEIQKLATSVVPPEEFQDCHSLLVSAAQLAESAARIRRQAALTGSMDRAWEASSAAAGALMLTARAQTDMQAAFRLPQLPR